MADKSEATFKPGQGLQLLHAGRELAGWSCSGMMEPNILEGGLTSEMLAAQPRQTLGGHL